MSVRLHDVHSHIFPFLCLLSPVRKAYLRSTFVIVPHTKRKPARSLKIAMYPALGLVSYGSEAAATKAPLAVIPANHRERLLLFFKKNDPAKVAQIDRLLAIYKDEEHVLWEHLQDRYPNAVIPSLSSVAQSSSKDPEVSARADTV